MKLNESNYFSKEASQIYTGSSEIKSFLECEARTLAGFKGEWEEPKSDAMLVSSFIDDAISGALDTFKKENPQIFTQKGELKSQYKIAEKVLEQIKKNFRQNFSGS